MSKAQIVERWIGELWGKKLGRNWVTTVTAAQEYMARNRRPGPKPRKDTRPIYKTFDNYIRYR